MVPVLAQLQNRRKQRVRALQNLVLKPVGTETRVAHQRLVLLKGVLQRAARQRDVLLKVAHQRDVLLKVARQRDVLLKVARQRDVLLKVAHPKVMVSDLGSELVSVAVDQAVAMAAVYLVLAS
ncbi:hypothetical protein AB833_07320 [Chromatiales bacterium (ex Bugula neritina AB1)]|nr:hypothetical protein AB833_07320 [Chromatiales bacterium (ex Bugula neritina AB1)]